MKTIALTALAMTLATWAWAGETGPTATPIGGAGTTAVHLSESQMDLITAGDRLAIKPPRFTATPPPPRSQFEIQILMSRFNTAEPTPQRSGFDLQNSLFGGSIFVAPPGCGGFGAEFGC
jgi:hypothetical protein